VDYRFDTDSKDSHRPYQQRWQRPACRPGERYRGEEREAIDNAPKGGAELQGASLKP
jgi:hypothetical protein